MRWFDYAHASRTLLIDNLVTKGLHSCPVHLRPEVMFGMIAVVEPDPVIEFVVTAHTPSNWFVRIAAIVTVVAVEIRQAVTKVPEPKQETDVVPIEHA